MCSIFDQINNLREENPTIDLGIFCLFVWAVGKYNWTNNIGIRQSGFRQLLLLLMKSQENYVHGGGGRRFNCYLSCGTTYFCCICRLGLACSSCPGLQRVQHDIPGLTGKSSEVAILERVSRPKHTKSKIVHTLLRETSFKVGHFVQRRI